MTIAEIRKRKMPKGSICAVQWIHTRHGPVILEAKNWRAIADLLDSVKWKPAEPKK